MAKGDIKAGKGALVGGAGEYLVVGELLRLGWLAALTPRGLKDFDVFATKNGRTIYVRVKTKTADASMFRWNRRKGAHKVLESTGSNDFCVLVDLASASPEYYVMTTEEVEGALQLLRAEWLAGKPGRNPENSMFTIEVNRDDLLRHHKSDWAALDGVSRSIKPDMIRRRLRDVFWDGDNEFSSRVARLSVLFEDLRVEYHGAFASEGIGPLDQLSRFYRQLYFIRRSLVTLGEVSSTLQSLDQMRGWRNVVDSDLDAHSRRYWTDAIAHFQDSANKAEVKRIRNFIGGHFLEKAATLAVRELTPTATGILELDLDHEKRSGRVKLHFCTELLAVALRGDLEGKQLTEKELRAIVAPLFSMITRGWVHAHNAAGILFATYLVPRFQQAPEIVD